MTRSLLAMTLAVIGAAPALSAREEPEISVTEREGGYVVAARFAVPEPLPVVREVLTNYANIPRFMPAVRRSVVLERDDRRVRVEQEAVSRYMMFSKTVYLVLDIEEGDEVIAFRDRCVKSFLQYEGSWMLRAHGNGTQIEYQLMTRPAFSVPGFVLRKLLNRDALVMVYRLRTEIRERSAR